MQQLIKYLRLAFSFDTLRLQEEVNDLSSLHWQQHYQKLHYEGEWTALPLRSVGGKEDNILISPVAGAEHADTSLMEKCPYIKEVLNTFQCPLLAVRLLKLNAGAVIKEHRDAEMNFERGEVRLHIPVKTNDRVEFYLDNERMMLKEGECWYMNFNLLHRVTNNSGEDRIHLVIDAVVNDWVKDLFNSDKVTDKKVVDETDMLDDATKRQMIGHFRNMNTATGNQLADELEQSMANHQ